MATVTPRPVPMLGDISLEYVQQVEQRVSGGFIPLTIPGLDGQAMQQTNRGSHRIEINGLLFGESASDQLATLQTAAADNEELTFVASITDALDIQQVVIDQFSVLEDAGRPGVFQYAITLLESPPLPPPAEVSGFGGLDGFGLGDLGFDTDILGDLADQVGAITDAIDQATEMLDALGALANLDGLSVDGLLEPLDSIADNVGNIGTEIGDALDNLLNGFNG